MTLFLHGDNWTFSHCRRLPHGNGDELSDSIADCHSNCDAFAIGDSNAHSVSYSNRLTDGNTPSHAYAHYSADIHTCAIGHALRRPLRRIEHQFV